MTHSNTYCWYKVFAAFALLISLQVKSQPKIALTADVWNEAEELPVKGRQGLMIKQKLSFGQYVTQKVDRSWTKESSWSIGTSRRTLAVPQGTNVISYDHINRKQTLRFAAISPEGQTADVYAATQVQFRELRVGDGNGIGSFSIDLGILMNKNSDNLFYVQIYLDGNNQPWQLVLDNTNAQLKPGKYTGILFGPGGSYYQLKPITHIEDKKGKAQKILMGSVGYNITDEEGNEIAAVSTMNNGTVYFSTILRPRERFLLENLCAAILLQEQI